MTEDPCSRHAFASIFVTAPNDVISCAVLSGRVRLQNSVLKTAIYAIGDDHPMGEEEEEQRTNNISNITSGGSGSKAVEYLSVTFVSTSNRWR